MLCACQSQNDDECGPAQDAQRYVGDCESIPALGPVWFSCAADRGPALGSDSGNDSLLMGFNIHLVFWLSYPTDQVPDDSSTGRARRQDQPHRAQGSGSSSFLVGSHPTQRCVLFIFLLDLSRPAPLDPFSILTLCLVSSSLPTSASSFFKVWFQVSPESGYSFSRGRGPWGRGRTAHSGLTYMFSSVSPTALRFLPFDAV